VQRPLLLADAVINLLLGVLLLLYPQWLAEALGMPEVATNFFPNVLGGVLFGIGLALLIAHRGGLQGLGLDGAIAINLCGAGVVAGWLVLAPHAIAPRGKITLWIIAILVFGIGLVELQHRIRSKTDR
jgi:nitrate reductase gamma subunit